MVELNVLLSFLWAFVVTVFAIPSITYVAHVKNLLDEPDHRRVHASLTPRLGGLAIFAGVMSSLTIFGDMTPQIQRVVAAGLIVFFIGLKDDIIPISAFKKFFVQILATGIVMFLGEVKIDNFQGIFGMYDLPYGLSYGFTFLVIIGLTNAINLIDGLDGLAGTIILIASVSFGIYFYQTNGSIFHPYATVAFCLAGAIIGFLRYNIRKAIIFMGDTGSLVCGLLLSVMAIQFVQMRPFSGSPVVAIAVLIIPIFDTIRVFTMRILSGKSPFAPDKNHIHHVLMELGLSQLGVVATLAAVNIVFIVLVRQLTFLGNNLLLGSLAASLLFVSILLEILLARKRSRKPAVSAAE